MATQLDTTLKEAEEEKLKEMEKKYPFLKFQDFEQDGMDAMKKMVLTVFREHPEMTKGEIEQYIKDNL